MKVTIFKLLILAIFLTGCEHTRSFRSDKYPIAPGEFQQASDAPALVETPKTNIQVRAKSFNDFVHVGLNITPKEKDVTYSKKDVSIESLKNKDTYVSNNFEGSYACPKKSFEEKFTQATFKPYVIAKDCILKLSYVFDTTTFRLFSSHDVMDGFTFHDNGLEGSQPIHVEMKSVSR